MYESLLECKVNWDYGLTMSVAISLTQRAKRVNYWFSRKFTFISFHADFVAVKIFSSFWRMACFLQVYEPTCRTAITYKSRLSSNFANETLHITKFFSINHSYHLNERLSRFFKPENLFGCFTTMHHKAKLSQWITKEKSFPSWYVRADTDARQHQCYTLVRADASKLYQFRVCVFHLVLACTVHFISSTLSIVRLDGQLLALHQWHCHLHVSEFFYPVELSRAKKPMLGGSTSTGCLNLSSLSLRSELSKQGAWHKRN